MILVQGLGKRTLAFAKISLLLLFLLHSVPHPVCFADEVESGITAEQEGEALEVQTPDTMATDLDEVRAAFQNDGSLDDDGILEAEMARLPETPDEADAYAKKLVVEISKIAAKRRLELKQVPVYIHFYGMQRIPDNLRWILDSLSAYGVKIDKNHVRRWDRPWEKLTQGKRELIEAQIASSQMILELRKASVGHPELEKWCDPEITNGVFERLNLWARQFFGLPKGFLVTLTPFVDNRTGLFRPLIPDGDLYHYATWINRPSHVRDLSMGFIMGAWTAFITYTYLSEKFPGDPTVHVPFAIATATLWTILFKWADPGTKAYLAQSKTYSSAIGKVVDKLTWSVPNQLILSFVAASTTMWALLSSNISFEVINDVFWKNANGTFAKILPNRLCTALQNKMSHAKDEEEVQKLEAKMFWLRAGIDVLFEVIKFGAIFQKSIPLLPFEVSATKAYFMLGGIGIGVLILEHFFSRVFAKGFSRNNLWFVFKKQCKKDSYLVLDKVAQILYPESRNVSSDGELSPVEAEPGTLLSWLGNTYRSLVRIVAIAFGSDISPMMEHLRIRSMHRPATVISGGAYMQVRVMNCPKYVVNGGFRDSPDQTQ